MNATATLVPGTLRTDVLIRNRFHLLTDEPPSVGGDDMAETPHELLAASLAACVATTVAQYARTKEWELGDVRVDVRYDKDSTPRRFLVDVHIGDDLTEEQFVRLERAAATCPVRRALETGFAIEERVHASLLV